MKRWAVLLLLALAAGCGWDDRDDAAITRGGVVDGQDPHRLLEPARSPGEGAAADIVAGEKLALAERGGRVGPYTVNFVSLDERAPAEAARTAIGDAQAVAVIGGLRTPETRVTAPLLNAAGYLQVVLGAGYPGFTGPGVPGEPERYVPAAQPTFARLGGDAADEAEALVAAAVDPRPRVVTGPAGPAPAGRTLAVEEEAGDEAAALAAAVRSAARRAGLELVGRPARADAIVYAGEDPVAATGVLAALAREAPRATLVLPEALGRAGVGVPRRGHGVERPRAAARLRGALSRRLRPRPRPGRRARLRGHEPRPRRDRRRRPARHPAPSGDPRVPRRRRGRRPALHDPPRGLSRRAAPRRRARPRRRGVQDSSRACTLISGTAASATEIGHPFLAVSAASWKVASSTPGTRPTVSRSILVIANPSPCLRSWTLASVRIDSGTLPPSERTSENAIEKQLACAAAISSSGLLPAPSSKRDPAE